VRIKDNFQVFVVLRHESVAHREKYPYFEAMYG
jgi:hypothetical protein